MDEKGFVEGVRRYMSQLREEKRYSSAKSYQDALNSFIKYSGTENISYSDINKANLHRYEAYLLENDCMRNTVSTYIRRLRCIYNKAVENGDAEYIPGLLHLSQMLVMNEHQMLICLHVWILSPHLLLQAVLQHLLTDLQGR